MSRHYKPGESDDLDFVRMPSTSHVPNIREELTEADDDPTGDDLKIWTSQKMTMTAQASSRTARKTSRLAEPKVSTGQ